MLPDLEKIAACAYSSRETVQASFDLALAAIENGVRGDFVECGVAAGANAAAMAYAVRVSRPGYRRVHLFDSFCGIPQAGPEDVEFLAAGHKPGLSAHSRKDVEINLATWGFPLDMFVFHEGLFQLIVPMMVASMPPIAVLRLDGDLYESTKVCIEHLYPLVSKGGWVIVDDWDLSGARKAILDHVGNGFGPIYWNKQP